MVVSKRHTGPLNPEGTREAILEAALGLMAEHGPKGVSFSEVARMANVDRGTAHRHFLNRENLLKATVARVSEKLSDAVFGSETPNGAAASQSDLIMEKNQRLLEFGMDNPDLCRIWLFEVLASENPMEDPFWRTFVASYGEFAKSDAAQENLNVDVLAIIMLAASFLWPIWVRGNAKDENTKQDMIDAFSKEMLRLSMYGSLKPERFPEIAAALKA